MTEAETDALVKRLRLLAKSKSEVMREIAQAKSLRQGDNPERRIDLYSWPAWEETEEWKAADLIEKLVTALDTRAKPTPASGTDAVEVTQADVDLAVAFVEALGFPQYAFMFQPIDMLGVHFDIADAGGAEALALLANARIQSLSRTEDVHLISDARTIAAVYLDADMSDVFSGGYDSHPIVCAALDGLRGSLSTRTEELVKALGDLREQARRVRNYSNPDEVFEAVPLRFFDEKEAENGR